MRLRVWQNPLGLKSSFYASCVGALILFTTVDLAFGDDGYYEDGGYYGKDGYYKGSGDDVYYKSNGSDYYYAGDDNYGAKNVQEKILTTFFEDTGGFKWRDRNNWLSEENVCYWHGVNCNIEGLIESIELSDNKLSGTTSSEIYALPNLYKLDLKKNPDIAINFDGIGNATNLVELKISDNDLTSVAGIGEAKSLEYLHLTNNNLGGTIPNEIFELTNLKGLYCNYNGFTGSLPSKISDLTELEEMYFHNNDLSGPIPSEIGQLENLEIIALGENSLTGHIPAELTQLPNLVVFSLQHESSKGSTGLTGPLPAFENLLYIEEFVVSGNSFTGAIPNNFLSGIENPGNNLGVDLSYNKLTGTIPSNLLRYSHLYLDVAANKISSLNSELCERKKWQGGDVREYGCDAILCPPGTFAEAGRQTSDNAPCAQCNSTFSSAFFGSTSCESSTSSPLTQRDILEQIYNALDGKFWKSQQNWLSLKYPVCEWYGISCKLDETTGESVVTKISLSANELLGTVPTVIYELPYLEFVDLSENAIVMPFAGVSNAPLLAKLFLSSTNTKSLQGLSDAAALDMLDLGNCVNLDYSSLNEIFALPNLKALLISHNNFDGPLPSEIGALSNLLYLRAYASGFSGQIPSELGNLSSILVLDIAENDFTGVLPTELNKLTNLELLSIHQVGKTGPGISGQMLSFSQLHQLTELYLDSNSLTGSLPPDLLASSKKLEGKITIGLSQNQLEGDIPAQYDRFEYLNIDLTENKIGGIPTELCSKSKWQDGWVGKYGCDAILCPTETYSTFGKRSSEDHDCQPCSNVGNGISPFLGATKCLFDDSGGSAPNERETLEKIFFTTGGRNWNNNDNWLDESIPICYWYGVTCDAAEHSNRVVALNLTENNLNGEFPSESFNLPYLERLNLKGNAVNVKFDGIEKAKNLKTLQLSETSLKSLNGIEKATSLEILHATDNDLSGPFPSSVLELTSLKQLYLNYNMITGKVPQEIGRLENLEELFLFHNKLSGQLPGSIGQLKKLKLLTISVNDLSGTLPEEINDLTSLEILSLEGNNKINGEGIGGPLLDFSGLENIQEIFLNSNSLSGTIPENFMSGIKDKSATIKVDLISNDLEGTIPASLAVFDKLRLYLADNRIEGINSELCSKDNWMNGDVRSYQCAGILCPPNTYSAYGRQNDGVECEECTGYLTTPYFGSLSCATDKKHQMIAEEHILEVFFNAMNGNDWKINSNWMDSSVSMCDWYGITCLSYEEQSIKAITLPRNKLSGTVPTEIFHLPSLRQIDLSHNNVDISFSSIGMATELEYLNLDETGLKSMEGIEQASSLNTLHLMSNQFYQDKIPENLFKMQNLEVLYLSDNSFSGELPEGLRELTNLKFFSCFACGLEGYIPEWIGDLSNIEFLRLDENSFSGSMPDTFSNLKHLEHLDISQQQQKGGKGLSGPLPDFIGCSNLAELYLFSNSLSGNIPSTFLANTNKDADIEIDLRFNNLEGEVPVDLAVFEQLSLHLAGNSLDTLPKDFCKKSSWMSGSVSKYKCDAIMCPPQTYNVFGRQKTENQPCLECPQAKFYGSTSCGEENDDVNTVDEGPIDVNEVSDREILTLFYEETRGISWVENTNWVTSENVCEWFGIVCENDRVVSIELESNGVSGQFPPETFQLDLLENLNLKGNRMTFTLAGIEYAKNLKQLVLSDMGLVSIEGIGKAPALETIHLTDNEITGSLPAELFEVKSLRKFLANYNHFSGKIPPEIENLTELSELYLYHNMLTGEIPPQLGKLSNLTTITLAENSFHGTLPTELNNLVNIKVFAIQRESVDGSLNGVSAGLSGPLISFSGWKNVREIYLGSNMLTGQIPSNFLSGLEDKTKSLKLDLTLNKLTGTIPSELANFGNLKLYVAGNKLSGLGDGLCKKKKWMSNNVQEFGCDAIMCPPNTFNEFGRQPTRDVPCEPCKDDTVAPFFGSLQCESNIGSSSNSDLTVFDILMTIFEDTNGMDWNDNNNWGDKNVDVCEWYGVVCASNDDNAPTHITKLELASNNLVGVFPQAAFMLPSLSVVELQENTDLEFRFTKIGNAIKLKSLNIDATKTTLVDGIENMSKEIDFLSMQDNDFGAVAIPLELFSETRLKYLNIANSNFIGTLPNNIGNLSQLIEFHCAGNNLTGQIPRAIGNLARLEVLAMSENNFSGTLPETFNELRHLKAIYLDSFSGSGKGITGPLIPFSNSPDLVNIYIGGNSLSGSVPSTFLSGIEDPMQEVNVMLRSNSLTGTLPATLAQFKRLNIDIAGNKIEGIHPELCKKREWMGGKVEDYKCDAILCPPGTFNLYGRQSMDESPCEECVGTSVMPFYGALECGSRTKMKEREILEKFYHQNGGQNWKNSENWLDANKDYCDWFGITCHDSFLVDSILLGSNNVEGTPPKELFELENLQWLWLYSNPVNFNFDGIEKATKLTSLLIDSTSTTSIEGVGKAESLTELDFRFNSIGGKIPEDEFSNLKNLVSLSLSDNMFSGTLPTSLNEMKDLKKLRLGNNRFTGTLPDFASNPELKSIDLSSNKLKGTIPETLLKNLDTDQEVFIDLSMNGLTGTVPSELARFDSMTLYLRDNRISAIDPSLCKKSDWMSGDVGDFDCDGLLCKPGFFSELGRESKSASCEPCELASYYGASFCGEWQEASSSVKTHKGIWGTAGMVLFFVGFMFL